jgi:hypothetical protein
MAFAAAAAATRNATEYDSGGDDIDGALRDGAMKPKIDGALSQNGYGLYIYIYMYIYILYIYI